MNDLLLSAEKKRAFITFSSDLIGRPEILNYKGLIKELEKKGSLIVQYRWFEVKKELITAKEIHTNATKAIMQSDIFIAETTLDSIGVGQQINYAIERKIPSFLCVNNKYSDEKKALYFKGTRAKNLVFIYYENLEDLVEKLLKEISVASRPKLEKFNFLATNELKIILKEESLKMKISQSELLRNIVEEWISNKSK